MQSMPRPPDPQFGTDDPSAYTSKMHDLFSVQVLALRDIHPGEEITISCKI